MNFPLIDDIQPLTEMALQFTGYDRTLSCVEGSFHDLKNISSEYYPTLSPRKQRGICHTFTKFQGMIEKEGLVWVDNGVLYINGTAKEGFSLTNTGMKEIVKTGASLVFFPDKKWYNTKDNTYGSLDNTVEKNESLTFTLTREDGSPITWHDASYYESHNPSNGDYRMETIDGKTSLSVYSTATYSWNPVASVYIMITGTGIGAGFSSGDGAKVTVDLTGISWADAVNIFPSNEGNGKRSNVFPIKNSGANYIIVPTILQENKTVTCPIKLERKCPDMSHVVECQNRLWGCSTDGHEVYCSKLGDFKNWNVFAGISTDSWAATIGSDGIFTGAISFQGSPMFFKEESILRITISPIGAHSIKETIGRGVAEGSSKSLAFANDMIIYKSTNAICLFDGSYPIEVSQKLGDIKYVTAVGGTFKNYYYVCLKDESNKHHLFVYDITNGIWAKQDDIDVKQFCRKKDELFFVVDETLYSAFGTEASATEKPINWMIESNNIGYLYTGKKHAARINEKFYLQKFKINAQLKEGSHISMYVNYDDSDVWEHQWNMSGKGTNLFTVPIRPHRCKHFKYRLVGYGEAKIFSITKEYTEGSNT